MSTIPTDLLYTDEHEYLKATDQEGVYQVGITDYAQGELGDVVFVELPDEGVSFARMDVFGTVEAVKAVSDLYAPVSGEVVAVNQALADNPALVNSEPYGAGWMIRIRISDSGELDQLMGAEAYGKHINEG